MPEKNEPVSLDALIRTVHALHPDGDALDHLGDAVAVAAHLGETADHLVGHFVDQARRSGATWTSIGASMGMTKQAAQQRSAPPSIDPSALIEATGSPYSRFTPRARSVVVAAQDEARTARSPVIDTDHMLLGLFREPEGIAARLLVGRGVTETAVRVRVPVAEDGDAPEQIPFSAAGRKTVEMVLREALRLGHNYVGTEHVLLGVLAEGDGPGAVILNELGVDHTMIDEAVREVLSAYTPE
ncbi:Clp protease N-terminal domain-containing protein [Tsukamurella paurometabola]|uniref:Probable ATP-dependent Clp protease ATP-binding subunit n=1 Tax=Tsukamurella paurometabola TaxID=2061 RepID=A0A3P8LCP0_TSUPA|nr:Clp protease N-terminal domain-containing protein [Tsukamurella paurometabola]UEA84702.1 ATP-dependent Clp protease ATP-binding subunit [Tsukamurella paurometabola]VDR37282.1 Probable ATP-dependent Clp protease ATP-binding subunit [Tsukamurella paurometabola]